MLVAWAAKYVRGADVPEDRVSGLESTGAGQRALQDLTLPAVFSEAVLFSGSGDPTQIIGFFGDCVLLKTGNELSLIHKMTGELQWRFGDRAACFRGMDGHFAVFETEGGARKIDVDTGMIENSSSPPGNLSFDCPPATGWIENLSRQDCYKIFDIGAYVIMISKGTEGPLDVLDHTVSFNSRDECGLQAVYMSNCISSLAYHEGVIYVGYKNGVLKISADDSTSQL